MKVSFIGAGSLVFARTLFTDIMSVEAFHNAEVSFTDIDPLNLQRVAELCQHDLDANGVNIRIETTTDRRESFRNANYVVNCVRIGGIDAFETDIEIPLKYGVDQCVGDTLCIGGIMYGQRVIAEMLGFCKDIREVAAPGCIMLNYSNPNAMATWACNKYGGVKTLGLCHGEIHGEFQIAEALGIPRDELDFTCAGLNHQTWYISVKHDGEEMLDKLLEAYEKHPVFSRQEKVRIDMLRRFGYYSTESNGHLSEYLAWYRKRPDEIKDWICLDDWIMGETAGYLRYTREQRKYLEALETGKMYRGDFNVMNEGCITNLPYECVVEVPCFVDRNGIAVPKIGDLPLGCAAVCSQSVWVQKLAVEAAVSGDAELLKQAALLDPLTGAVCNPPEVWQMVDEMLIAQEKWLPQYKEAIADAKARWAKGNLIPTDPSYKGIRNKEKTVEEMIKEKNQELVAR